MYIYIYIEDMYMRIYIYIYIYIYKGYVYEDIYVCVGGYIYIYTGNKESPFLIKVMGNKRYAQLLWRSELLGD